ADPLAGLDGAATRYLLDALRTAGEGRRTIVWLSRPELGGPEGTLLREASDLVVFGEGRLVAAGPPDEVLAGAHLYELTVRAGAQALCDALVARGGVVRGGPEHFCLGLPDGLGPSDVLREALRVEAAVVRCAPLLG
ncbi:MAG: ABC transporter ATP-binding protein, partial [Myxococcales bacterium]|nr:ABC transporter ATP-binding protein [Myxococcales bacterium]